MKSVGRQFKSGGFNYNEIMLLLQFCVLISSPSLFFFVMFQMDAVSLYLLTLVQMTASGLQVNSGT